MLCPKCKKTDQHSVIEIRAFRDFQYRRRRECQECGHRFTTYEIPDDILRQVCDLSTAIYRIIRPKQTPGPAAGRSTKRKNISGSSIHS